MHGLFWLLSNLAEAGPAPWHNAFRKLDVRSRRELPQALGESPQA